MPTSNATAFNLPNADVIIEAFDRCEIRGTALTRNHLTSARRSLNLELLSWSIRGVNLWEVKAFQIQIVTGQAVYVAGSGVANISPNTISMLDVFWSQINGGGAGINIDRILSPIGETDYAQYSNKLQPGTPSVFWFQKLVPGSQQITIYQPPFAGWPNYAISGYYLSRIQDAAPTMGQTPDVPYLALDALCAGMAARLAVKFAPDKIQYLKAEADEAWNLFAGEDREDAPITILPAVGYMNRSV